MSDIHPVRTIAVFADTDSRWKWALGLARRLNPSAAITGYQFVGADLPSQRQLAVAGIAASSIHVVSAGELLAALTAQPVDVLVIALPGGGVQATLHALAKAHLPRRPVVVTGYVGVVYERIVEGLLLRLGADVIAVNSPADLDTFTHTLTGLGVDAGSLALTRLPFLRGSRAVKREGFTLTFAGQPGVPGSKAHRRYLIERLVAHAEQHPRREVIVKLRNLPGEQATHSEPYPYDELIRALGGARPKNLKVYGGDMGKALNRTDLLVTVSSTAAVEAMHRGIPTAVLTDFGIRESLGNSYFIGSGCLTSFDDLDRGMLPEVNPTWARRHGLQSDLDPLPERVAELAAQAELPPVQPYYTLSNAKAVLPSLLAGYGVGTDGKPLPVPLSAATGLRKVVRRSARNMYRQGSEVVAPVLRKLASL